MPSLQKSVVCPALKIGRIRVLRIQLPTIRIVEQADANWTTRIECSKIDGFLSHFHLKPEYESPCKVPLEIMKDKAFQAEVPKTGAIYIHKEDLLFMQNISFKHLFSKS